MSKSEIVEYDGKKYVRRLKGGYYCLKPLDGDDTRSTIMEHRLIYELAYGVSLDKSTHVHHLNRDKTDNRVSNLIAISMRDHHKLHNFEDRNVDMRTAKELDVKFQQYNSLKRHAVIQPAVTELLESLVVYDGVIYRRFRHNGYMRLNPIIDGKVRYDIVISEQRLVYELANQVKLPPRRRVYHINGIKDDNRPDNLTLTPPYSGQKKEITVDELSELIKTKSNCEIARMYGVGDSTVGKWRSKFGLPSAREMQCREQL